jgi:cobalt/nickel transport system permease protein
MHLHFLDPYRPQPSLVHRLDSRVKLVLALAFIITVSLTPAGAWPVYLMLLAIVISVEILSELGVGFVLKRSMLAIPFALAAVPIIFTYDKGAALASFSPGPWTLTIYQGGLERFVSILFKSWLSVQMAIVLATSTPFPELLVAMRAIRIPRLLVAIFGLMWRYMFVLADEAMRLIRARTARSSQAGIPGLKSGGSLAWRARVTGGMAGSLFLRGIERSDRIYMAMAARGYDGEVRSFPTPRLNPAGWLTLFAGLATLTLLLLLGFLL